MKPDCKLASCSLVLCCKDMVKTSPNWASIRHILDDKVWRKFACVSYNYISILYLFKHRRLFFSWATYVTVIQTSQFGASPGRLVSVGRPSVVNDGNTRARSWSNRHIWTLQRESPCAPVPESKLRLIGTSTILSKFNPTWILLLITQLWARNPSEKL